MFSITPQIIATKITIDSLGRTKHRGSNKETCKNIKKEHNIVFKISVIILIIEILYIIGATLFTFFIGQQYADMFIKIMIGFFIIDLFLVPISLFCGD